MKASKTEFCFEVTNEDLAEIRNAIQHWKADPDISLRFDGSNLFNHFERWKQFVDTDWEGWDISEYNHDIGCRAWIQLAIEYSTPNTAKLLEKEVSKIDKIFKQRMKPFQNIYHPPYLKSPFKNGSYFWETNTIHEELWEQ